MHGDQVVLSYTVAGTSVLEVGALEGTGDQSVFTRTLNVAPRSEELVLQIVHKSGGAARIVDVDGVSIARFGGVESGRRG